MIHLISDRAQPQQVQEMLEALQTYIKLAVDVCRQVVAGGGILHADCEAVLLEDGSRQEDVWGADWILESREVRFESLINIRPKRGNRSLHIEDPAVRTLVESVVRARLET